MSPPPPSSGQRNSFVGNLAASAFSASFAEACTIPLDTAKVRLQLQAGSSGPPKYRGMLGTVATVAREEGAAALWKGIGPGIHRQVLFGGLRIGLYEPIKDLYVGKDHVGDVPLHLKVAAGLTTGAVGITIASPTDLVKVRMQAEGKLPEGAPRRYPSAFKAYGIIAKQEGVAALWTGLSPNIMRNAIINAAELASYDQVKSSLLSAGMSDGVPCHILSGLGAGFVACVVGSPVDVIKSRVMAGRYSGFLDCAVTTARVEGLGAFWKGFLPNFGRLGSWNVVMFLTLEQVRKAMRDNNLM
ncbi:mitochondrial carrier family [Micromonas commoda]|uniref:Mitochondrial carrier family n=1 Tax=Micromonas commoda (strain RCC299 / NOUM17 / CCMP2709) TaxID=296587 RepID=C1E0E6_MICCC|nr:mitochondrial carrier family [Micromonas commoda]ACO61286.1 mitochondrial carrier family [Micromonas commoda]|eukprot:XP_002500028.1 mitochondrial carrier family [Micromonas commoda]